MTKKLKKPASKLATILTSLMMVVVFTPTFAFADGAADDITVFMTVSDQGELAQAKDGSAMVEKEVTAKDIDKDGHLTVYEALVAAHEEYFEDGPDGVAVGDPNGYGIIATKLWGVETINTLFYLNGEGLKTGIVDDEVAEGDAIYASVNKDDTNYSDWFTVIPDKTITSTQGKEFTVNVQGHSGMAYTPEEMKNVPVSGVQIGTWNGGVFTPIEGAVTDEKGNAKIKFDDPGAFLITAKGTIKGTDWMGNEVDCPIMAPYAFVQVEPKNDSVVGDKKTEAMAELMSSYNIDAYRTAEQIKVLAIVVKAQAYINNAASTSDINMILNAAKEEIAAVMTDQQHKDKEKADIEKQTKEVQAVKIAGLKVKSGKKKATVSWKKNTKVSGYELWYKKPGAKAKTIKINKNTTVKKVVKKLTKGKKYTFKVRGFKKIGGKMVYGKWSSTKKVKIK